MQAYSSLNSILSRESSTFSEFQTAINQLKIETETYLNLFLTSTACKKSKSKQFSKYVTLLTNFKEITGKKSANINYIGYKDRISILMHVCQHGNPENISFVLGLPNLNLRQKDPSGRNALFYAIRNTSQDFAFQICDLLLDLAPDLIFDVTETNSSVLFEAVFWEKYSLLQKLIRRGADVNTQLKESLNTVCHEIISKYHTKKSTTLKLLVLFSKFQANFEINNHEGRSVFDIANEYGFKIDQCENMIASLEKEASSVNLDNDCDKQSLTTLNQATKMGDNASQLEQIESNICSQRVDFSQIDQQQDSERDNIHRFQRQSNSEESFFENLQEPLQANMNYQQLEDQILAFSNSCEEQHRKIWILIQPFLSCFENIIKKFNLFIQIVGSFATGLWSNNSDIDINLIPLENQYIDFESTLQRIYREIRHKRNQLEIEEVYFNKARISSIKLVLGKKYGNIIVDIAIFHRNNQNRAYVCYILESINAFPQVKPLFFLLRKIAQTFGIHDQSLGGIKTYTLFLMIFSIVKNLSTLKISELLNHVTLYYGFYYEYEFEYDSIDLNNLEKNSYDAIENFPKLIMNFIDPLNPKNNVGGKNTKVLQLQNMFKSTYFFLNTYHEGPFLNQLFELHSIF